MCTHLPYRMSATCTHVSGHVFAHVSHVQHTHFSFCVNAFMCKTPCTLRLMGTVVVKCTSWVQNEKKVIDIGKKLKLLKSYWNLSTAYKPTKFHLDVGVHCELSKYLHSTMCTGRKNYGSIHIAWRWCNFCWCKFRKWRLNCEICEIYGPLNLSALWYLATYTN